MRYSPAAVAVALTMTCWTARVCQAQATDAAHKKVAAALEELTKAETDLVVAKRKVDRSFQSKPQWIEAAKTRADAQAKYEAVSKAATQSLQDSPAYKAAVEKKHEAEQHRDAVRRDPNATPEQRTQAATEVLTAASAVTRLERQACAADPAVVEAKNALTAANAKLAALRQSMENEYNGDKDVQTAKKQVEDDKTALAQAKKDLAVQLAELAAAENAPPPPRVGMMPPPPPSVTSTTPSNHTAK